MVTDGSEGNCVTCMLSYLMFQVNGEVRFKWLISHFACKTKTTNRRLLVEICNKYKI